MHTAVFNRASRSVYLVWCITPFSFFFLNIFIWFGGLIYHNGLVAEQTVTVGKTHTVLTALILAMAAHFHQVSKQHRQWGSLHFQSRFTHQKWTFFPVDAETWRNRKSTGDNIKNICSPFRWNCTRAWYFSCCLPGVVYEDTWFSQSKLKSPSCAFLYIKKKRLVIVIDCESINSKRNPTLMSPIDLWNKVVNTPF